MTFKIEAVNVVKAFARTKPWRGDQIAKRHRLHNALCKAYGIHPTMRFGIGLGSFYDAKKGLIVLATTSVITQLHEFAHALNGSDEEYAVRWSLNMFREHFPLSFSRLRFEGHLALKPPIKSKKKEDRHDS
jgi:hypothetical protein|tara:strand:- start:3519 stop:3911 length:393 start_codon:yes stop_codon:yes gene_type:complete